MIDMDAVDVAKEEVVRRSAVRVCLEDAYHLVRLRQRTDVRYFLFPEVF